VQLDIRSEIAGEVEPKSGRPILRLPKIQVSAKAAVVRAQLQVLVGSGNEADIHGGGTFWADGTDFSRLQDAEQLGLQRQWQIANLVEEHVPPVAS
jgi:hypothetical protein